MPRSLLCACTGCSIPPSCRKKVRPCFVSVLFRVDSIRFDSICFVSFRSFSLHNSYGIVTQPIPTSNRIDTTTVTDRITELSRNRHGTVTNVRETHVPIHEHRRCGRHAWTGSPHCFHLDGSLAVLSDHFIAPFDQEPLGACFPWCDASTAVVRCEHRGGKHGILMSTTFQNS